MDDIGHGPTNNVNKLFRGEFSICTWNSAGLCGCSDITHRKVKTTLWITQQADIVNLQETHDDGFRFNEYFRDLIPPHEFFGNRGEENNAGGTNIIIRKIFSRRFKKIRHKIVESGRIHYVHLEGDEGELIIFNFHLKPCVFQQRDE